MPSPRTAYKRPLPSPNKTYPFPALNAASCSRSPAAVFGGGVGFGLWAVLRRLARHRSTAQRPNPKPAPKNAATDRPQILKSHTFRLVSTLCPTLKDYLFPALNAASCTRNPLQKARQPTDTNHKISYISLSFYLLTSPKRLPLPSPKNLPLPSPKRGQL